MATELIKPIILNSSFVALSLQLIAGLCFAQEAKPNQVLELSSRIGKISLTVNFFDTHKKPIPDSSRKCENKQFFWAQIPPNSRYYQLVQKDVTGDLLKIPKSGNVYIRFKGVDYLTEGKKIRAVFYMSDLVRDQLTPEAGETKGYCYIGKLKKDAPTSTWKSLYVVAGEGLDLDRDGHHYTYKNLEEDALKKRVLVADFPLYFRKAPGKKSSGDSLIRAGQSFRILRVLKEGTSVYAHIDLNTKSPTPSEFTTGRPSNN